MAVNLLLETEVHQLLCFPMGCGYCKLWYEIFHLCFVLLDGPLQDLNALLPFPKLTLQVTDMLLLSINRYHIYVWIVITADNLSHLLQEAGYAVDLREAVPAGQVVDNGIHAGKPLPYINQCLLTLNLGLLAHSFSATLRVNVDTNCRGYALGAGAGVSERDYST